MLIQNGLVFFPDGFFRPADLEIEGEHILAVEAPGRLTGAGVDAGGCFVTPGLVDIHIHGCAGADICDGTTGAISAMGQYLARQGVTSFLGTTMALPAERLQNILTTAAMMMDRDLGGAVLRGVNLEGPFFAANKKGAQNADYLLEPDIDLLRRLQTAAQGGIRLVDLAPELPGALDFIREARSICPVSLAHTAADYSQALAAFDAGASHVTHIFNAMGPFGHREPGLVGAAVERAAQAELICDGIHVHPAVVRTAFSWFGPGRICLISDAMSACGMPDGAYELGGQAVEVSGGAATLADGTIAGSATDLAECLRRAVSFGIPLEQAFLAATAVPARAAGLEGELGSLAPGKRADVVLWGKNLEVREVFLGGSRV